MPVQHEYDFGLVLPRFLWGRTSSTHPRASTSTPTNMAGSGHRGPGTWRPLAGSCGRVTFCPKSEGSLGSRPVESPDWEAVVAASDGWSAGTT
mmetsp:Transcript_97428/g.167987  ORF Transcript_97428/g.167987 Transcript_97428/m.167987 type:complete len:93 (+) Transcript_97428:108-386(+)